MHLPRASTINYEENKLVCFVRLIYDNSLHNHLNLMLLSLRCIFISEENTIFSHDCHHSEVSVHLLAEMMWAYFMFHRYRHSQFNTQSQFQPFNFTIVKHCSLSLCQHSQCCLYLFTQFHLENWNTVAFAANQNYKF